MLKIRLLQAACTVAMLAAVPAFAQTNTPPGATGSTGAANPVEHQAMPGKNSASDSRMAPANKGGMGASASEEGRAMHRSMMAHPMGGHTMGMKHGQTDSSQDDAVNNLNDQSYQAAQKGQAFGSGASDSGSGGMTKPGGSGRMNGMSGGSMSGGPMSGGSMSGGPMSGGSMSGGTGTKP